MDRETPFGDRYLLVRHLASGGMADLHLGRRIGVERFAKEIVIKRIQERFAAEPRLVKMFLDEARIAALLSHPNIVSIHDIGEQAGSYYIVMEYLHAENLWAIARRGLEAQKFLPLEHAVKILAGVCEGLEYAHNRTDSA